MKENVKLKKETPKSKKETISMVALRDIVVFPNMSLPLFIGRPKSLKAVEETYEKGGDIFFVAQLDSALEEIKESDVYNIGTICKITQLIKLSDGTVKILVDGLSRGFAKKVIDNGDMFCAMVTPIKDKSDDAKKLEALRLALISNLVQFAKATKKIPEDIMDTFISMEDPSRLCDTVASYIPLKVSEKQSILATASVAERLEQLIVNIEEKSELLQVEKKIKSRVKRQVEKSQKEYYLNEQLKAIYKELGDAEDLGSEVKELESKIKKSKMSSEAKEKALHEAKKLKNMPGSSQEGSIIRTYIDWLITIPWDKTKNKVDMAYAEKVLDESHYGLDKIKERILEYVAVSKRVNKMKGQIMCFVGPPGVGKTSLGKAIAEATKKNFARVALGGVSDESEIRGHRRTYIGAMPGKIIQAMKKAKSTNPIIMLDEIDKLGSDWRGDPASALLEVLDPEQNVSFSDHYIEVPYDLSDVMFITTANSLDIPYALLDRMEIINLTGYMDSEKIEIAKRHIMVKQLEQNGLKDNDLQIGDDAYLSIIRDYTRESGVRNLEREISKIARKSVRKMETDKSIKSIKITKDNVKEFLGIPKYSFLKMEKDDQIGVVTGMAWTESGGDLLAIETMILPGSGNITSTGKLGEVMQESIKAAFSYAKSVAGTYDIDPEYFSRNDVHVHVPEGAVPKDGPSAGITICTAIISAMTNKKIRHDVAMTGEITLYGKVLPIGGLKEKLLAAIRGDIKTVFIPKQNEIDLEELPNEIKTALEINCISHVDEVLGRTFV